MWYWAFKKNNLTSSEFDLICCCLTVLPPPVGWDIIGYESEPLPSYMWSRNRSYTIILKLKFSLGYSTSRPISWSYHLTNLLYPGIFSSLAQNSCMGQLEMCKAIVTCKIWMYYLVGHSPVTSRAPFTSVHSKPSSLACRAVFFEMFLANQWWKPYITVNITLIITQLSFP